MVDYSQTKVYRVVSQYAGLTYIGSTHEKYLCQRMGHHRYQFKKWNNKVKGQNYCSSFEILKYPDAEIILLQSYPECKSSDEKRKYEQEWIDNTECVNKHKAFRSKEEHKEYNKNYSTQYRHNHQDDIQKYREENRDIIRQQQNIPNKCSCGGKYTNANKAKHERSKKHLANLQTLVN
jgi:hypothetical protein